MQNVIRIRAHKLCCSTSIGLCLSIPNRAYTHGEFSIPKAASRLAQQLRFMSGADTLHYAVYTAPPEPIAQGGPPGFTVPEGAHWSPTTVTLLYGDKEAILAGNAIRVFNLT